MEGYDPLRHATKAFLGLKTVDELRDFLAYFEEFYQGHYRVCFCAIDMVLEKDLPLYLNHPSRMFRLLVKDRLKGEESTKEALKSLMGMGAG